MSKVAIIGAGRVGTAAAKILLAVTDHKVVLIDSSEQALADAYAACSTVPRKDLAVALEPEMPIETFLALNIEQIEATLKASKPDVVICATPFNTSVQIAEVAQKCQCHYIDFTEDENVSKSIRALPISRLTFVPQTGLAPGLVSYLGLSLLEELGTPHRLDLRVGALPQVSFGPAHYAITWSTEGLVNEYLEPAYSKNQHEVEQSPPLDELETIVVSGIQYEAFTTAGGIGNLASYETIPSVQYKTMRYPGHLEFLQKMFAKVNYDFDDAVLLFKQTLNTTRDDMVVLVAHATDTEGASASLGFHFYPSDVLGLTALELTTAGTGVGIVELILNGDLPAGVLNASQIPFDKIMGTAAVRLIFEYAV